MAGSWPRRFAAVLAAAGAAACLASGASAAPRHPAASLSALERGVYADINTLRVSHDLPALRLSGSLTDAARAHSQEMETDGYFAHNSFDGTLFWKVSSGNARQGMPPFSYLPEAQRWQLVLWLRTQARK